MTPAERAALRELVARTVDTVLYSYEDTKRIREALPKLLDDCDRLERERDEARLLVRQVDLSEDIGGAADRRMYRDIDEAITRWDAEDVQPTKEGGKT